MKWLNIENTGSEDVTVEISNGGGAELVYQIIGGSTLILPSALSYGNYTIGTGRTMQITAGTYSLMGYQDVSDPAEQCRKLKSSQFHINILSGECKLTGDVTALITNEGNVTNLAEANGNSVFSMLFVDSQATIDAGELELPTTTLANYCYRWMFYGCTSLTTAPELPATTLADSCYESMFQGCKSLITAPVLPATTLATYCYAGMFWECTSLTSAPELPATTLANYCYRWMFDGCSSLTTAPELPATILADYCYESMFYGCTSLTTAPELPATALAESCYESMFQGCTSLTTAPELPATTLANYCYRWMFYGCTSLSYIKCLATDINASDCTYNWVQGVADSGTFICAKGMEDTWKATSDTDYSHAPYNWTIHNEEWVPEPVGTLSLLDVTIEAGDTTATMTITATEIETGTITVSDITY